MSKTYTLLALGDSYTAAENVSLHDSFPYQTVQMLRKAGYNFNAPEIIAQTGWTTTDLKKAIRETVFQPSYEYVTLLIGVNDQYQHESTTDFAASFEQLLRQAIVFAGNKAAHVFVFSIPDWAQTPFAENSNRELVTAEIKTFNSLAETLAGQYHAQYIVTNAAGKLITDASLLAPDKLHPSGKEYAIWAGLLGAAIQRTLA